jgi:hypothetical protein
MRVPAFRAGNALVSAMVAVGAQGNEILWRDG